MNREAAPHVVNAAEVTEENNLHGERWGTFDKPLTPSMRERGGKLGVVETRLPPGRTCCPFHYHLLEDEAFYVLSGRGVHRYGDDLRVVGAGDCISCPAGTRVAHQMVNPFDEDLVYLSIGPREPNEVCVYPDNGKVMVRSVGEVGFLEKADYYAGEPDVPEIFALAKKLLG